MNMKKIINRIFLLVILFLGVLLQACEENYLKYDDKYNGLYFTKDSVNYSFGIMPEDYKTHTYRIPVSVMGLLSNDKRYIGYEIVDSVNAENGVHYTIGEACVMPDSITGYIPVTIMRDKLEGTYGKYTKYRLTMRLVPNEAFVPTLDSISNVCVLSFDKAVEQPEWYNRFGDKVWSTATLGEWHPYKLIKMVEFFHKIETVLPETYKDMVALYGENLEHIENGDPYRHKKIFVKYIYSPMYDFFNDPSNRDKILSDYPDFVFDFPDPYAEK